jgi:hypothetical protein
MTSSFTDPSNGNITTSGSPIWSTSEGWCRKVWSWLWVISLYIIPPRSSSVFTSFNCDSVKTFPPNQKKIIQCSSNTKILIIISATYKTYEQDIFNLVLLVIFRISSYSNLHKLGILFFDWVCLSILSLNISDYFIVTLKVTFS